MMDYGGGDRTAGWPHGQLLGHCAGLCVQALGGDLKTAWQFSFSDEKRVRGVGDTRRAIRIDVLPFLTFAISESQIR